MSEKSKKSEGLLPFKEINKKDCIHKISSEIKLRINSKEKRHWDKKSTPMSKEIKSEKLRKIRQKWKWRENIRNMSRLYEIKSRSLILYQKDGNCNFKVLFVWLQWKESNKKFQLKWNEVKVKTGKASGASFVSKDILSRKSRLMSKKILPLKVINSYRCNQPKIRNEKWQKTEIVIKNIKSL